MDLSETRDKLTETKFSLRIFGKSRGSMVKKVLQPLHQALGYRSPEEFEQQASDC